MVNKFNLDILTKKEPKVNGNAIYCYAINLKKKLKGSRNLAAGFSHL